MSKKFSLEIKVGLFVLSGVLLVMLAILLLGGGTSIFSRPVVYTSHFVQADGLFQGAKVVVGGLNVGKIEQLELDPKTHNIRISFKIDRKYKQFIRQGSEVEVNTQGVLGDKYVSITMGATDQPELDDGSELPNRPTKDLKEVLGRSDQLMTTLTSISGSLDRLLRTFESESTRGNLFRNLNETAKNLSQASNKINAEFDDLKLKRASASLNQILDKINNGSGTLGALLNDPSLYDDIKSLTGGANRNRVVRNLVRKTIKDSDAAESEEKKKK